ncbi:MAG: uracil-DNA glycosylase, partial [Hyphomicrobiaceae bacterium]
MILAPRKSRTPVPRRPTSEPPLNCAKCTRLVDYRQQNKSKEPAWHNAPVPSFGKSTARILVVGLAPGLKGANKTGRPFTGDYAGDLLYATLIETGLAAGTYDARPDDSLKLIECMISNAVRCVPPANKPTPAEINTCNGYLAATMAAMPNLQSILALGRIAHDSELKALQLRRSQFPFGHGQIHDLGGNLRLYDSYHCSRY